MSFQASKSFGTPLNVQSHQASSIPRGFRHEWIRTPSQSLTAWGTQSVINFNSKNINLEEIWLEFSMPAITGLTVSGGGTAAFVPTFFWITRLELLLGNTTIDTITGLSNFLWYHTFAPSSEKLQAITAAAGLYSSHATRATKSGSAGYWYLPISSVFNQAGVPLLTNQDLTLRITMAALADSYTLTAASTATGTAAGVITACTLLTKVSYLPAPVLTQTSALMRRAPLSFAYTETKQQTFAVSSGITSSSFTLTGITGLCPFLFFVVRGVSPSGINHWTWDATVSSFEIMAGGSQSIVGGSVIRADQARYLFGKSLATTFMYDNANVFIYVFAADALEVAETASNLGGYTFNGSEQLKLNWASSTSAGQLDVVAYTYSALSVDPNSVKKIALA